MLALGTPGSYGILQTQAQALVQYLDFGLPLQEAIEAPRARLLGRPAVQVGEARRARGPSPTCASAATTSPAVPGLDDEGRRHAGRRGRSRDRRHDRRLPIRAATATRSRSDASMPAPEEARMTTGRVIDVHAHILSEETMA